VVLAVWAMMAVVLVGIYRREEYLHYRPSCQSNEKQIALGFRQYIQDYGDTYPPPGPNRTHDILGNQDGWADSLEPYEKSAEVFKCPTNDADYNLPGNVDYGYNVTIAKMSEDKIHNSSSTVLMFEATRGDGAAQTASVQNTSRVYVGRHLDGSNYTFVDGHVKWLRSARCPQTVPANGNNFTFGT